MTLSNAPGDAGRIREAIHATGAVVVSGVDVESDEALLDLVGTLGKPTAIGNGSGVIHEVMPRPDVADGDLSSSAARFPLHTDSTFLLAPHDYVALACQVSADDAGGRSLVVHVDDVRARIERRAGSEVLAALAEAAFPFLVRDPSCEPGTRRFPIFACSETGWTVRYRSDAVASALAQTRTELSARHRMALLALEDALADAELYSSFMLRPGDVALLDNRHTLHGREAIADGSPRVLRRLKAFAV